MKEKIKPPKGFIQIFLIRRIAIAFVIVLFFIITGAINQTKAEGLWQQSQYHPPCFPEYEPDPETGCRVCDYQNRDPMEAYEQCRQAYYLKKQTELLILQQVSQTTLEEKEQTIKELELNSQKLQELFKEQSQRINSLTSSLKNANLLNIGLSVILVIILFFSILKLIRKNGENYKK